MPIDTKPYERRILVRPALPSDLDAIVELVHACYTGVDPKVVERTKAQLERFPQGQFVALVQGRVMGYAASMRTDLDTHDRKEWLHATSDGFMTAHDPEGPDLYGVDMMVHPDARRMRIGQRLYEARRTLVRELNLRRIVFGGRMPNLHKHPKLDVDRYVELVYADRIRDPTLTFQFRQGFHPIEVVPEYLPWDKESRGYGLLMEWTNLEYRRTGATTRQYQPVRVVSVQYPMGPIESYDEFLDSCTELVQAAAGYDADFVLFPELFTLRNACHRPPAPGPVLVRDIGDWTDAFIEAFRDLATRYAINIIAGSHPVQEGDEVYNVAFLFHRDGRIDRQAKIHITPGEKQEAGFEGGHTIDVFRTDRGVIGIPVCYDIEFPELARIMVDAGARILFVPYSTRDRQGHLRVTRCAQSRAIENQVFVVTAGTVGHQPTPNGLDLHYAQSGVYTPSDFAFARDGILSECAINQDMLLIADLDLSELHRSRRTGTVRPAKDRRHDLYRLQVGPEPMTSNSN